MASNYEVAALQSDYTCHLDVPIRHTQVHATDIYSVSMFKCACIIIIIILSLCIIFVITL